MLDILRKRRSIRRYKDKEIEPAIIEQLKEAALRSPSSRGINPWRFLFITDRARLEALSRAKESGSSFLKARAWEWLSARRVMNRMSGSKTAP